MKKVNIYLILLLSLSVFSCTKIDEESLTPVNASVDVYQTMIVGKWKLVAVGTVSATVSDPDSPNAPAEIIDWTPDATDEVLNFTPAGGFTRTVANEDHCKGTFRINRNKLYINSGCAVEVSILDDMQYGLVLGSQNEKMRYKYVKL